MTDHAAHLAAIRANPDQDAPRLIYADWLEEQGDGERAEFIRVQCKLAALQAGMDEPQLAEDEPVENLAIKWDIRDCKVLALRQRERELWRKLPTAKVFAPWAGGISTHPENSIFWIGHQDGPECFVKRGFVAEVRCRLADWMGGPCCVCDMADFISDRPIERGCKACHGTGTLPGIGPALVRQQPVEVVRITDMPIYPSGGNNTYYVGGLGRFPHEYWQQLDHLPSRQAAQDALSQACLLWAKRHQPTVEEVFRPGSLSPAARYREMTR